MIALVLTLLATLSDPPGDAFGNGSLVAPRAPVYRDVSAFDLRTVRVLSDDALTVEVEMGSLPNPVGLPLGFSHPVVEIYLDTGEGGRTETLEGSGMQLPEAHAWDLALRLTGDRATAYRVGAGAASVVELPATVRVSDATLVVDTPFGAVDDVEVFAVVGLYDPLGPSIWRAVEREPSTWSFSSPTQSRPVVDVLAPNAARQAEAIDRGRLARLRPDRRAALFPVLMGLGLVVALVGLLIRRRVGRREATAPTTASGERPADDAASPPSEAAAVGANSASDATAGASDGPRYLRDRAARRLARLRRLRVEDLRDRES